MIAPAASVIRSSDDALAAVAEALNAAERVTILAGAGCGGAHDELVALAAHSRRRCPYAAGQGVRRVRQPLRRRDDRPAGIHIGYRAMEHCDALLMLGTDFPYRPFFPEHARMIQVDVAASTRPPDPRGHRAGRDREGHDRRAAPPADQWPRRDAPGADAVALPSHSRAARRAGGDPCDRGPIHPQVTAAAVERVAADDAVFLADVGTPTLWAARYLRLNGRRRLIGSFNHGSMANALPQAIGVQASHPGRQVVSLSGDGGLSMLMGELLTFASNTCRSRSSSSTTAPWPSWSWR